MSSRTIQININLNFTVILIAMMILHGIGLSIQGLNGTSAISQFAKSPVSREPIKVQRIQNIDEVLNRIRTVGAKDSKIKDSVYVAKTPSKTKQISKEKFSANPGKDLAPSSAPKNISLSDLSMPKQNVAKAHQEQQKAAAKKPVRPGTRPESVLPERSKAISAISLKGSEIQQFLKSSDRPSSTVTPGLDAASVSGDPRAASLSNSDVMINLEVPEGVNPDELNKYELMFYGFQRRTAINYVNSVYKRLDKFRSENPHMDFPMTDTKQVMTGRLTYDEKGNIKQIKMVRWSNVQKLQDYFEGVLKDMDTLHNPPQALWEKTGEFSIFFSLVVNG
jgi:hypothetical protein